VDRRGTGGIVFAEEGGSRNPEAPVPPPSIVLSPEQYNRITRLLEKEMRVLVEVDLKASFSEDPEGSTNVVAEIPGGTKKDEIVMMGAHLDSWHASTGATDNASGCAVVMEAMRILKALDLEMDRTVRMALWGGEEQGLLGSRGYVEKHFGDPVTMRLMPDHSRLAAYFNLDNGGGKIRGVHLQGNDMARPIFESWLAPFKDLGAENITIRKTGGTDHLYFDALGLPGFQFVQDPLDYGTRTHHSNLDVYDRIQPGDLMQAAAIMASLAYHAATREGMLPRKPLPAPLPPRRKVVIGESWAR
jgi:Zn-dependent M28 family amino/carboxypeptidase